ncbi:Protein FMP25, mitochondrial [Neolecta irregularis DAH-3]|uniref:Protein FMP25, mitochondrial n=1 Tax=Neolecta irregularis (strain DAH-3) TaxID=1198029 RepID=A0A1U7LR12_NEOID|nr:Protein FMP25, mitochondrial [Neolecta irregularis DAH-3]|eukprot:OLL24992.1 Protein FMP25, mitochondrial [Neolecta irregularis DAH-3]
MTLVITARSLRNSPIKVSSWTLIPQCLRRKSSHRCHRSATYRLSRSYMPVFLALGFGSVLGLSFTVHELHAEERQDLLLGANKEDIKHPRITNLWERPGVYVWGSNKEGLLDPETKKDCLITAISMKAFEGQALRDLYLGENYGVVVNADGDLIQWGSAYSNGELPEKTLAGKNIMKISIALDRIFALSRDGKVYVMPLSKDAQQASSMPSESSWIPFLGSMAKTSFQVLDIPLHWGEKISDITTNTSMSLFATSKGRLFIQYPNTKPTEVKSLNDVQISQVTSGDSHALARSTNGKVFTIGSNTFGQLGLEYSTTNVSQNELTQQPLSTLYLGQSSRICTDVSAGGNTTYFTVISPTGGIDVWACGFGQTGQLGNNAWTQAQGLPVKLGKISGLSEYIEKLHSSMPIIPRYLSTSSSHTFIVLDSSASGFGNDVYAIGSNYDYQLGTGKRNSINSPTAIPGLDGGRMQLMPKRKMKCKTPNGKMKNMNVEQRIWAGKKVSVIYTAVVQ